MFKNHWEDLLCNEVSNDYMLQTLEYSKQLLLARSWIKEADAVIIGAGSGASTAAGLDHGGKRFVDNFQEFIDKYGSDYMTDMYAGGFYPFESEEAKWGYWSKDAMVNRILPEGLPLYKDLYQLVKDKDYFVLTTNVDGQFIKSGFDKDRIFATQGDYKEIQCSKACHNKVYDATSLFKEMDALRKNCLIPKFLVPKCPVCGHTMTMHLRSDNFFVEDEHFDTALNNYIHFLSSVKSKKVVLIELGVGFNTPVIIRLPFEKMVKKNKNYKLIRLNKTQPFIPESIHKRSLGIDEDMHAVIKDLLEK